MDDLRRRALQIGKQPDPSSYAGDLSQQIAQHLNKQQRGLATITPTGEIAIPGAQITKRGLIVNGALSRETWSAIGNSLMGIEGALQWLIGDWIVYGNQELKIPLAEIGEMINRKPKTLQNWAWVIRAFPFSRRKDDTLTFGHHALVAGIESPDEQDRWLRLALDNDWSVAQMQKAMRGRTSALPPGDAVDYIVAVAQVVQKQWGRASKSQKIQIVRTLEQLLEHFRKEL